MDDCQTALETRKSKETPLSKMSFNLKPLKQSRRGVFTSKKQAERLRNRKAATLSLKPKQPDPRDGKIRKLKKALKEACDENDMVRRILCGLNLKLREQVTKLEALMAAA